MHTEYPTIKEKAATRNYEQDVSLLTDLLIQLGDVQLKKTLGKARRKGHDGAENTQAGEGGGGGGANEGGGSRRAPATRATGLATAGARLRFLL